VAEPNVHVLLPHSDSFDFSFSSDGGVLAPGAYPDAAGFWYFGGPPRPGIDISAEHRGCSEALGNFDVLDFAVRADGRLERLWIQFDQRCDQLEPRLFGEIRIGMPVPSGPAVTAPALARWPDTDVGRFEPEYPVALIAAHDDVAVAGASLTGVHAGDFRIADDQCRGRAVPRGGACFVWVAFEPRSPGAKTAALEIDEAGGRRHAVPLQGFAHGGRTRMLAHWKRGYPYYDELDFSLDLTNMASLWARGTPGHVDGITRSLPWDWSWRADFGADPLAPGAYPNADDDQDTPGPYLRVDTPETCTAPQRGSFTVHEAAFSPFRDSVRRFGASFERTCDRPGDDDFVSGTFEFRAGDTTQLPPWLVRTTYRDLAILPAPGIAPPGGQRPTADGGWQRGPCGGRRFAARRLVGGTARADRLRGGRRSERIVAGAGNDRVFAGAGADCVDGGRGRDRIEGGRGRDLVVGGLGRDLLDCGRGRDVAYVTRGDRVRRCERRLRARAAAQRSIHWSAGDRDRLRSSKRE
jgi:hypothetical protein